MSSSRPATPANGSEAGPLARVKSPVKRTSTPTRTTSPAPQGSLANATPNDGLSKFAFQLDTQKLLGLPTEQQDLYLLSVLAELSKHIEDLSPEGASEEQAVLKGELLQIITLTHPPPARVIRDNVGRCFARIFSKNNRKLLYETINDLVALLSVAVRKEDKTGADLKSKHAAVVCLGFLFQAAGDSAMSLSPLACTAILKLQKIASNDTGLRASIYRALGRLISGLGAPIDEDLGRMIWKQARKAAADDRSSLVQHSSCYCLEQLVRHTAYFVNSNDFEKLQGAVFVCLDSSNPQVRNAAASCLATVLVKSYSARPHADPLPRIRKPKKSAKKSAKNAEDSDVEPERTASPALERPATTLSYSLLDLFKILSMHYCRSTTTNKARAGITVTYIRVLKALGARVVEENYEVIALHLFQDILNHPSWSYGNKYRSLLSRRFVKLVLEKTVRSMLGETAQLNAIRWLVNDVIKDYPQSLPERREPSKHTLTAALSALTSLMNHVGAAVGIVADACRDGLLQVIQHPSFTVQIHAARAMRALVSVYPKQTMTAVTICLNTLVRELGQLGAARGSPRRCLGWAHGLAAILSTSQDQPLYGSLDVYVRVLAQATRLLKTAASSDIRVSSCQLQCAWIMIGGLMSLGPNFVKIHLTQLMLLWKNALTRPVASQRNMLELSYLAHVRECALGSIRAFLTYNRRLLTGDISRRLSSMLENGAAFIQSLPEKKISDEPANRLSPSLQLQDYEVMVRRRLFQCSTQLLTLGSMESLDVTSQGKLLPLAVATFSGVDNYAPSSLSAAIATAAANFESIWEVGDNYGFGVTGLINGLDVADPVSRRTQVHWSSRHGDEEDDADAMILNPIGSAVEHDGMQCYLPLSDEQDGDLAQPPTTEVVNAAIAVFGLGLAGQTPKVQESLLEQMMSSLSSSTLQKDPARRSAIAVNIALALLTACKVPIGELGVARGSLRNQSTERAMQALLHACLKEPDESTRYMAAAACGRLCLSSGTDFTTSEVTYLTETIVENREPNVRAGCALALASMHSQLGGMAASYHMRTIVGILMSLAADTHPTVHMSALYAMAQVAESAGLNFSAYVTSAIGMLGQLYVNESHNAETPTLASSNMSMLLPVTAAIARGVDAITNVLGPDLQDMTKARDMLTNLIQMFSSEADIAVLVESLRCLDHLSLYAPGLVAFDEYVRRLQRDLDSEHIEVAGCAIQGLFTLMRRDAAEVIRSANPGLEDRLWDYMSSEPDQQHIRAIFTNWLQQTGPTEPVAWIRRCNDILTKTESKPAHPHSSAAKEALTAAPDLQDEEVAGFAAAAGDNKAEEVSAPSATQELTKWQVRLFAMECLHSLIDMIGKEAAIAQSETPGEAAFQDRVADIVRIAFSASTAGVTSLRIVGLRIVGQILRMFGRTPDPDFPEAMLLEQYQAQISSALTPAFAADSSPELAAEAVNVCATFIATGIVTDVDRMGRILKLLVSALESFSEISETTSIGDLQGLSANAGVMVRLAVFSAWAKLQIASSEQQYLIDVLSPHIAQLLPHWLASLREYSRLRFEPDISQAINGGAANGSQDLDMMYSALNRQTLLKFYQDSWLSLVDAIASLIDEDSDFVFDALDGKHVPSASKEGVENDGAHSGVNGGRRKSTGIDYREEPVAFFFVLFGLAFESLATRSTDDAIVTRQRNLDILQALKKILRPSVAGTTIYQEVVFSEMMDLLDRMVLTESLSVQAIIVEIARNLCIAHPSSRQGLEMPVNGETLSDDIEQLFELTRIIVLVLAGLIPGLSESPVSTLLETSNEAVGLVTTALQALVDVSEVFPSIIKADLHATILHIFVVILGTGACQAALVPQALPIFRRFLISIVNENRSETQSQLRNALARMLLILRNAQQRETEASLPCEKNTLLAMTILVSVAPSDLSADDPLVDRFISELSEGLENPLTCRIVVGCIRTLLIADIATTTLLTTGMTFILNPSQDDSMIEGKSLMSQSVGAYISKLRPDQRPAGIALAIRALLGRASNEGISVYPETATRVLELANLDNVAFRSIVASVDGKQKLLLQQVLKSGAGARRRSSGFAKVGEPTIALKLDFGG